MVLVELKNYFYEINAILVDLIVRMLGNPNDYLSFTDRSYKVEDKQRQAKLNSDNIRCFTYSGNRLKEMYEQNKIRDVPQYWTHFV